MENFLKATLNHLNILLWDLNLETGALERIVLEKSEPFYLGFGAPNEDEIRFFVVHSEGKTEADYEDMLRKVRAGETVEEELIYVPRETFRGRLRLQILPIPEDDGSINHGAVIIEDRTEENYLQGQYSDQLEYFHTLAKRNALFCVRLDMDEETVLEDLVHDKIDYTYQQFFDDGFWMEFLGGNNTPMKEHVAPSVLRAHRAAGHWKLAGVFHAPGHNERGVRFLRMFVRVLDNPKNGHLECFAYAYDDSEGELTRRIMAHLSDALYDYTAVLDPPLRQIQFTGHPLFENNARVDYDEAIGIRKESYESPEAYAKYFEFDRVMAGLREKDTYSGFFKLKDGRDLMLQFSWLDKEKYLVFLLATDVTEQMRREQTYIRQIEESLQAAEQANAAKTEFVSRISHDIRTPIGAVLNLTDFAKADMNSPEKLKDDLDRISTSGRFLLSLINDVLDIAKIDSGKIELKPEYYTYKDYVSEIVNIFEPMCDNKGLTCTIETDPLDDVAVWVDKVRLNQITLNLLSNAVRYTNTGGHVTFRSHREDVEAEDGKAAGGQPQSGAGLAGNFAAPKILFTFEVEDTGIGMSEEFQKVMFEEFAQETNNPYRQQAKAGTGLGLPIVKKLVDLMNGEIEVESTLGRGTRMKVSIPLEIKAEAAEAAAGKAGVTKRLGERSLEGIHVLLAEDNEINSIIAERIFSEMGVSLDHAPDGAEAVRMFAASKAGEYQAIFMDIQMPLKNGYEATEEIRVMDREDAGTIPIIAMTADAFADAMEKARAVGMSAYITKPLEKERIRAVLEDCLKE